MRLRSGVLPALLAMCAILPCAPTAGAQDGLPPDVRALPGEELVAASYRAFDARYAPDGKGFYFLSERERPTQVWWVAAPGGEPRRITDLPYDLDCLDVSPDGKLLAFQCKTTDERKDTMIGLVGTDGRGFRQISSGPLLACWPAWHPSGRFLVWRLSPKGVYRDNAQAERELVFARPDGTVLRRYVSKGSLGSPRFSSEGDWVYLERVAREGTTQIVRLRVPDLESAPFPGAATPPAGRETPAPGPATEAPAFEVVATLPERTIAEAHPLPGGRLVALRLGDLDGAWSSLCLLEPASGRITPWLLPLETCLYFLQWAPDGKSALVSWSCEQESQGGVRCIPVPPLLRHTEVTALRPPSAAPRPLPPDSLVWRRWFPLPLFPLLLQSRFSRLEASAADGSPLGVVDPDTWWFRVGGGGASLALARGGRAAPGKCRATLAVEDLGSGAGHAINELDCASQQAGCSGAMSYDLPVGIPCDVSADAARVALLGVRDGKQGVEIRRLADDVLERRLDRPGKSCDVSDLRWSPRGDRLAMVLREDAFLAPALWVAPTAGVGESLLLPHHLFPLWSPDGGSVFAIRSKNRDTPEEVVQAEVPAGTERVVLPGAAGVVRWNLQWNEPGRSLLVFEADENLPGGDATVRLVSVGIDGTDHRELSSGALFAYAKHPTKPWLALLRADRPVTTTMTDVDCVGIRGVVLVRDLTDGSERVVADDLEIGSWVKFWTENRTRPQRLILPFSPAGSLAWRVGK